MLIRLTRANEAKEVAVQVHAVREVYVANGFTVLTFDKDHAISVSNSFDDVITKLNGAGA